jgi:regulatory protein
MPHRRPVEISELRDGTVTAVRAQKRDPDRVAIHIDGEFAFGLAAELAVRAGLRKGLALSAAEQTALLSDEQRARARGAALELISYRPRTEAEIRRRLQQRGFDAAVVEEAVARMRELGYLDDEAYVRTFVAERLRTRGHGPARLRADLLRRGASPVLIDSALAEFVTREDLHAAALRHATGRWKRLTREADPQKRRKKLYDFLVRRGYDFEMIREVLEVLEREG